MTDTEHGTEHATDHPGVVVRVLRADGGVDTGGTIAAAVDSRGDDDVVWVDLVAPGAEELDEVAARLGPGIDLHPLVREDVFDTRRRTKIDRYDDHVFLDLVDVRVVPRPEVSDSVRRRHRCQELDGGEVLVLGMVSAIVFAHRVITVRSGEDTLDVDRIGEAWAAAEPARRDGAGLVVHTLLDQVVDRIVHATEVLDEDADELEQAVISDGVRRSEVQARAFTLRKATAMVRRVAMPTREVVGQVLRRDGRGFLAEHVAQENVPYLHDVADHVVRVAESLDGLRDELTSVLEFNMSLQDTELNQVMKKLSAWAAIIAVPTAVTGYFGQNVPYPGFSQDWGFWQSTVIVVVASLGLWWWFRRLGWL